MALIVEDGTGIAGSEVYSTEAAFIDYIVRMGLPLGSGDPSSALRRGTAWLDARYRARFPGVRLKGRDQGREYPRVGGVDAAGLYIPSNAVPLEVIEASWHAGQREWVSPGSLSPDRTADPAVKRKRLGSMEVEYAVSDGGRPATPTFPVIEGILAPLIGQTSGSSIMLVRA